MTSSSPAPRPGSGSAASRSGSCAGERLDSWIEGIGELLQTFVSATDGE
ncbi:hypothetical protein [Amycolatopsis sp. cmx-4-61]